MEDQDVHGALIAHLKSSGLATHLKLWMRTALAQDLISKHKNDIELVENNVDETIAAAVLEFLQANNLHYSASVFASEVPKATSDIAKKNCETLRHILQLVFRSTREYNGSALDLLMQLIREHEASQRHQLDPTLQEAMNSLREDDLEAALLAFQLTNDAATQREIDNALHSALGREGTKIRNEERQYYESELERLQEENRRLREMAVSEYKALAENEMEQLQRTRVLSQQDNLLLRERLQNERENLIHSSEALHRKSRAQTLESSATLRDMESTIRTLQRSQEAALEEAKHATNTAKLQFERWKTEYLLEYEERMLELSRDKQRFRNQKQEWEEEKQRLETLWRQYPETRAQLEESKATLEGIRAEMRVLKGSEQSLQLQLQDSRETNRVLSERLQAADAALSKSETSARIASETLLSERDEWSQVVRRLKDQILILNNKYKDAKNKLVQTSSGDEQLRATLAQLQQKAQTLEKEKSDLAKRMEEQMQSLQTMRTSERSERDVNQKLLTETKENQETILSLRKTIHELQSQLEQSRLHVSALHTGSTPNFRTSSAYLSSLALLQNSKKSTAFSSPHFQVTQPQSYAHHSALPQMAMAPPIPPPSHPAPSGLHFPTHHTSALPGMSTSFGQYTPINQSNLNASALDTSKPFVPPVPPMPQDSHSTGASSSNFSTHQFLAQSGMVPSAPSTPPSLLASHPVAPPPDFHLAPPAVAQSRAATSETMLTPQSTRTAQSNLPGVTIPVKKEPSSTYKKAQNFIQSIGNRNAERDTSLATNQDKQDRVSTSPEYESTRVDGAASDLGGNMNVPVSSVPEHGGRLDATGSELQSQAGRTTTAHVFESSGSTRANSHQLPTSHAIASGGNLDSPISLPQFSVLEGGKDSRNRLNGDIGPNSTNDYLTTSIEPSSAGYTSTSLTFHYDKQTSPQSLSAAALPTHTQYAGTQGFDGEASVPSSASPPLPTSMYDFSFPDSPSSPQWAPKQPTSFSIDTNNTPGRGIHSPAHSIASSIGSDAGYEEWF